MHSFIRVCSAHSCTLLGFNQMRACSRFHMHPTNEFPNEQGSKEVMRMVYVAVIGMPNAGKSTLVNSILERRVVSVSKKVHTTRRETVAVANVDNTQMVFLDNPGFVTKVEAQRYEAEPSLYKDPLSSVQKADVVVLLHDVSDVHYKHHLAPTVVQALQLKNPSASTALVFNKVDQVKNKIELLDITRALSKSYGLQLSRSNLSRRMVDNYHKYRNKSMIAPSDQRSNTLPSQLTADGIKFEEVFMISALASDGLDELKRYILSRAKPCPWKYERGYFTDQSLNELVIMCVREKILDSISEEIPYMIIPVVESCLQNPHGYAIRVQLPCKSKRFASALMGREGKTIKTLAVLTEQALSDALQCLVTVKFSIVNKSKNKMS